MGPMLNKLIKLQEIENRLRGLRARLDRCQRSVIIQENQLRTLNASLKTKHDEVMMTRSESDRLELELKSRDADIKKYSDALNSSKNNKEYAAILTELNIAKADNSKLENRVLSLMKVVETEEEAAQEIKEEILDQEKLVAQAKEKCELQSVDLNIKLEEIKTEWKNAAEGIPSEALEAFQRVAENYDGEAIATVEQIDPKRGSYTCNGCFMGITQETVNQLMTKDEIIRCPNCTRIVVIDNGDNT